MKEIGHLLDQLQGLFIYICMCVCRYVYMYTGKTERCGNQDKRMLKKLKKNGEVEKLVVAAHVWNLLLIHKLLCLLTI